MVNLDSSADIAPGISLKHVKKSLEELNLTNRDFNKDQISGVQDSRDNKSIQDAYQTKVEKSYDNNSSIYSQK
jgi:hypothetical protein